MSHVQELVKRLSANFLPLLIGLLVGVPLLLLSVDLPNAKVIGSMRTEYLRFKVSDEFYFNDLQTKNLSVSFRGSLVDLNTKAIEEAEVQLDVADSGNTVSDASISGFSLARDSIVELKIDRAGNRATFIFSGSALTLKIIPRDLKSIELYADDCPDFGECFPRYVVGTPLIVQGQQGTPVSISFDLRERPALLANNASVAEIQFWEQLILSNKIQKQSGINSGVLQFLATPDIRHEAQPGEVLHLVPKYLRMQNLALEPGGVSVHFLGVAYSAHIEVANGQASLMPTLFETASRNPQIQFLLGALSIIFGAGFSFRESFASRLKRK